MLQEGASKGNEPAVQVLEICQNLQRKADDLLPYLSPFAEHFRPLPKNEKDFSLTWAFIPLNDIECFTKTVVDIPEAVRNLTKRKREYPPPIFFARSKKLFEELAKLAQDQFVPLCQSWNYQDWDEYDYGRIKTLIFRELDDARRKEGIVATQRECFKCPDFLKHVSGTSDLDCIENNQYSSLWSTMSGSSRRTSYNSDSSCQTRIFSFCLIMSRGYQC